MGDVPNFLLCIFVLMKRISGNMSVSRAEYFFYKIILIEKLNYHSAYFLFICQQTKKRYKLISTEFSHSYLVCALFSSFLPR